MLVLYVLCQLTNTKTQDGKQTLMHFLVDCIEKRFPDVMDFASELLHVEKAARGQRGFAKQASRKNVSACH